MTKYSCPWKTQEVKRSAKKLNMTGKLVKNVKDEAFQVGNTRGGGPGRQLDVE